jgi:hypothetical protein
MKPVVPMASSSSPFTRDTTFDSFLFAEVGEEGNGMVLSMVSALARLDLDPWREAASLSRLSAQAASERLTALLSSLPSSQLKALAPATVTRLLALLPGSAKTTWGPGARPAS